MAAKSSSVPALLLVAAVLLVAGMCTSPAHAAGYGKTGLVNLCDHKAEIYKGDKYYKEVQPKDTLLIDLDVLISLLDPLYIHINGKIYILDLGNVLGGLLGATDVVAKIELVCNDPKCGKHSLAIRVYVQVVVGGIKIGPIKVAALICLKLKV